MSKDFGLTHLSLLLGKTKIKKKISVSHSLSLVYEPVYIYIDSRVTVNLDLSVNLYSHKATQIKRSVTEEERVVGCVFTLKKIG